MTTPVPAPVPGPAPWPSGPTTLTARTPADLLAVVPVVLGFHPEDSLVLLTFGAEHPFHARVDLPRGPAELAHVVAALLEPTLREGAVAAAVIVYADQESAHHARRACGAVALALEHAGVTVVDELRADGTRFFAIDPGGEFPAEGVPYDLSSHPFTAQGVLDGRVVAPSRAELAAALAPDPAAVASLSAVLGAVEPAGPAEVAATVARGLAEGADALADAEVASLLLGIDDPVVREAAWAPVRRGTAREHLALWSRIVRRAPAETVGSAAAVLAHTAWVCGDGALAWCALDRCAAADPGNSLAALVADLLEHAVPPALLDDVLGPLR